MEMDAKEGCDTPRCKCVGRLICVWGAALLLAVGLTLLGIFIRNGFGRISANSRVVTVRGLSEREVQANKVTWPIVSKQVGNDLAQIYTSVETTNQAVIAFLKSNGLSDKEFSVNAPKVQDMQADNYGGQQAPYRYNVTSVIVVTSSRVDRVPKRRRTHARRPTSSPRTRRASSARSSRPRRDSSRSRTATSTPPTSRKFA